MALTRIDSYLVDLDSLGGITFDDQAGTPTLKVDATTHRVGIGTASPDALFTVYTSSSDSTKSLRLIDSVGLINIGHWDNVHNRIEFGNKPSLIIGYGAENYLGLGAGGSERLRITPDGNVGIGTTNPITKLHVNGSGLFEGNVKVDDYISHRANQNIVIKFYNTGTTTTSYIGLSADDWVNGNTFKVYGQGSNAERMRIASTGNVGIGTAIPSEKLHVYTGASVGAIARFEGKAGRTLHTGTDPLGHYIEVQGTNPGERVLRTQVFDGSTGYAQVFLDGANKYLYTSSNVNVGIGITNPQSKLDVLGQAIFQGSTLSSQRGTLVGAININNNSADGVVDFTQGIVFTDNVNNSGGAWTHAGIVATGSVGYDGNLVFGTDGDSLQNTIGIVERMRITSSGNVGIGTTNPTSKLHIFNGDLELTGGYNLSWGGTFSNGNPTIWGNASNKTIRFAPDGNTTSLVALLSSGGFTSDFVLLASSNSHQITNYTDALKYFDLAGELGSASYNGTSIGLASKPGYGVNLILYLGGRQPILPSGWTGTIYCRGNANASSLGTSVALQTSTDGDAWTTQAETANTWDVVLSWTQSTAANVPIYVRFILLQSSGGNVGEGACRISDIRITNLYARPFSFGLANKLISQYNYQNTSLSSDPTHYQAVLLGGSGSFASNNIGHGIGFYSNGVSSSSYGTVVAAINSVDEGTQDAQGLSFCTANSTIGSLSEKLRITNTGNVGIGTTNPGTKLDIYGDIAINGTFALRRKDYGYSATYKNVLIGSPDSVANTVSLCVDVSTISGSNFHGQNQVIIPRQGLLVPNNAGTNFIGVLSRDSSDYIRIGPDAPGGISSGPITVTTSNVGIGTTNPQSSLDLKVAPATSTISTLGYSANASLNIRIPNVIGNVGQIVFTNNDAPTAGYASIGVIMTSGAGVGLGDIIMSTKSNTADAASQERLRITSSGNVGIGTTNPASKLVVDGVAKLGIGVGGSPISIGYVPQSSFSEYLYNNISTDNHATFTLGLNATCNVVNSNGTFELRQSQSHGSIGTAAIHMPGNGSSLVNNILFYSVAGPSTAGTTISESSWDLRIHPTGVQVAGSFSKGSGSFRISHPLPEKSETHDLVHSFVESPQANNIYRGKVTLVNGSATINLDEVSGMTEGTFVLLNRDIHCFTSNESDWDAVRGSVDGNILTIECQNTSSSSIISWLVIGERQDQHMYDTDWTDENGKVIVEPLKESL